MFARKKNLRKEQEWFWPLWKTNCSFDKLLSTFCINESFRRERSVCADSCREGGFVPSGRPVLVCLQLFRLNLELKCPALTSFRYT